MEKIFEIISFLKQIIIFNNSLYDYIISIIIFFVAFFSIKIIFKIILIKISNFVKKTKFNFDDIIIDYLQNLPKYFLFFLYLYFPLKYLNLSIIIDKYIDSFFMILVIIQLIDFTKKIINVILKKIFISGSKTEDKNTYNFFKLISTIGLRIVAILLILVNLGFQITPLLASIGVGGIAIAFALQNILQDIFASFSIYFDKPFKAGDFITLGTDMGTVEKVGMKSTHIKTLQGETLIVSNKELTSVRVNNYRMMKTRRVVFKIGVVYETPLNKLKLIPDLIQTAFKNVENVKLDRVHFVEYGNYSLIFEIVFVVDTGDKLTQLNRQQEINYNIFEIFEKESILFAYPTQTIFVNNS